MAITATREAYGSFLEAYGEENKAVVVLDADLSKSTMTNGFAKKFPERFFDMGIAEQNLMGVAAGMAAAGKTAVASTFAVFAAGRAFEIIRNSICYPKLNVKICATHAGLTVGEDGGSHQAIEDLAIMRALPNMVVVNPTEQNLRLLDMLGVSAVLPVVAQTDPAKLEFINLPAGPSLSPLQRMDLIKRAHHNLIALNEANQAKFSAFLVALEADLAKLRAKAL